MRKTLLSSFVILVSSTIILSCLWDYDTIEMERQQFPEAIELISGKFLRHSPEFHYWRVKDREKRIELSPDSLSLYDDLAVSLSKLNMNEEAIDVMLKKDSIKPGLYTTYANLGTLYLHQSEFKKGIRYIDKAIKINPDAHFGREVYQKYLAEYILSKKKNGKLLLPMDRVFHEHPAFFGEERVNALNFYNFLNLKYTKGLDSAEASKNRGLPSKELQKALNGVMGMMKFGNFDSPILLEALGDLLANSGSYGSARQLAARAYYKASYHVSDQAAKDIYLKRVAYLLELQLNHKGGDKFTMSELEELLLEEIEEGNQFYKEIRNNEIAWITGGKNPEREFAKAYYQKPQTSKRVQHSISKNFAFQNRYVHDTTIGKTKNLSEPNAIVARLEKAYIKQLDSLYQIGQKAFELEQARKKSETFKLSNQPTPKETLNWLFLIVPVIILLGFLGWKLRKKYR